MSELIGVVLYNPDIQRLQENIMSLGQGRQEIVFIDNASSNISDVKRILEEIRLRTFHLITNKENMGIAHALNQIFQFAKEQGADWVMTLDQDSVCTTDLIQAFLPFADIEGAGMLCPIILDRNYHFTNSNGEGPFTEIETCITSGSFTKVSAWEDAGKFDEYMFIDQVDFEFCYRFRQKGYHIFQVRQAELLHEIGAAEIKRFLWISVTLLNHNSTRKYYMARNRIYAARKTHMTKNILKAIAWNMKLLFETVLFENEKLMKIRMIVIGTFEGMTKSLQPRNQEKNG